MEAKSNLALKAFQLETLKLDDYCKETTELKPHYVLTDYPAQIAFTPRESDQTSLFGEDGSEPFGMVVTVGVDTKVSITAKDAVPASVVKKLIRLSERVALAYYQAYRESEGAI